MARFSPRGFYGNSNCPSSSQEHLNLLAYAVGRTAERPRVWKLESDGELERLIGQIDEWPKV
jgi:hypothetical protein